MFLTLNTILLVALSIIVSLLTGLFLYLVYNTFFKKESKEEIYRKEIEAILEDDEIEYYARTTSKEKSSVFERWNTFWGESLKNKFPDRYIEDDSGKSKNAGIEILVAMAIVSLLAFLLTRNAFASIGIAIGLTAILGFVLKYESKKKANKIGDQIVGFLYALKANIQAQESPESALIKVVDNVPSPLGDELMSVKHQILSNTPFKTALKDLKSRTQSEDLKSLCSYMIQSSLSGASIETQIDTIIETVKKKKEITDKIKEETRSSESQKYISAIIIPLMFIVVYVLEDSAREFWFVNPISWPILFVIIALCAIAFHFTNKKIETVKVLAK